jgi:thiosulfate/3-mercaptopyruvate sulfurtransferase
MPLISASELLDRHPTIRLLDTRSGRETYASGHLPGACYADPDRDLSRASDPDHDPARGGRHPLPSVARFAACLGAWGIGPDTEVVTYDASGGGDSAARLWWMLRALGHTRVWVLDGGLTAALEAGLPLTTEVPTVTPSAPYPGDHWRLPQVDLATVARLRQDPAWKLLDVRAPERWRGETEPFDPVAGRIPGSRNRAWTDSLGPDGRFLPRAHLRAAFLELLGDTPPERLMVHCGSGVTACHTLLALEAAGLPGASLYTGSWSEWCRSDQPKAGAGFPPAEGEETE